MRYYVTEREFDEYDSVTARGKARDDAETIVKELGYMPIVIDVPDRSSFSIPRKIWWQIRIVPVWVRNLKQVTKGDELFIQFPFREHSVFLPLVLRKSRKKGVRIVMLVHDFELFRALKDSGKTIFDKVKNYFDAKSLKYASKVILHNDKMIRAAKDKGLSELRLIDLQIFDYITDAPASDKRGLNEPLIVAGNLMRSKSGYLYDLPENLKVNLYGPGYEGEKTDNINIMGAFPPEELPGRLEGSFGIVWDGPTAATCDGVFGKYLTINNPHKTSLYLASGLPVIIWKEAALADFIVKNGLGIAVNSLGEIPSRLKSVSEENYNKMVANTKDISGKLRTGFFLKKALKE